MFDNRREIMQDVFLTYLPAQRFKTSRMTVQLIAPLQRETAAANALLPAVLRRGTVRCPDMESLSAALDTLYGANIDYTVRKKGERQCVGFAAGFIDDAFTPHGEKLLEPVSAMLGELLLDPVTHGGRFLSSYVESEKANLIDAIRGLKNDKRDWADIRLMQEMCAGEPYSVLRLGDEETAGRITNQSLYVHGQALMASSRVEVIYCGSAEAQRVEDAVLTALAALPRGAQTALPEVQRIQAPDTPRRIVETMDVTQGKLAMGYRCSSDDYPAMVLANLIFGGTSNSKLFLNVRERLSLCYYASSSYARSKSILTVSSGVETADFERAETEIGRQLQAVQQGDWEDWEQEGALQAIRASLLSLSDSQGALENFYLGQIAAGVEETPEELAAALEQVTKERIVAAAQTVKPDTVYFLRGKEEA
ncbi:EF-P 5-aminopentanol modification-associated protein YfmF [Vescimonas sanitatis]|uniref:EF-P 5-aminopentanol modification-associated protein YfmF n=1 Tax=Vescimonas sanitatis TaxID=3376993 RepID=UPI003B769126